MFVRIAARHIPQALGYILKKMRKIIIIQLLIAILFFSCKKESEEELCSDFKLEEPTLNDETDYEIINAVLETYFIDFDFLHIVQKTKTTVHIELIEDKLASENIVLDSLTKSDFLEKNESEFYLSNDILKFNSAHLISNAEFNCFFSAEYQGWEDYYNRYPKSTGIHTFTRPGINDSGTQAIIEYGWQAHYDTGMGYFIILEKENNIWQIKHRFYTWAS